ncbi:MAG: vanadium-dependent haloperoxidase [Lewinellaceae bacterium]|nr:vanadium-dependent haloperoxidase [Lewinellaceae bacterium]
MKALAKFPLFILLSCFVMAGAGCDHSNPNWEKEAANPDHLHKSLKEITDVIVHDIFSPPVASRIYTYSTVAAYEAMVPGYPQYQSLAGQLTDLTPAPQPEAGKQYCYPLAGAKAMLVVGKALIFSEEKIDEFEKGLMADFQKVNMPKDVYDRSLAYGEAVAKHILAWADKDNYKQTRTFPKYTITDNPARWKPTPPDYMDAIEPHWNMIRPFVIDSAQQFPPPPPTAFDMKDKNSQFYKEALEVYNIMKVDTPEMENRLAIAKFWDCNPYVSHHKGHVMFATKKITPGGHWMGIAQIACKTANADIMKSAEAYALTAISLADAFISCWDEKYRSELIRPETVINTYIDQEWTPVLQTPPFPEYTSGHSVISASAATALTTVFGDNFAYTDSVEVEFGMPPRSFKSFREASSEAAVSRLYGGIHYSPACMIGVEQGKKVGSYIAEHVKMNKG